MSDQHPLATRTGLPDALRILLRDYPRAGWEADPGFAGLLRFWLDRHLMFRDILIRLQDQTEQLLNNDIAAQTYAADLSRYGGTFVQELHAHHHIEDTHYFPKLVDLDSPIAKGFAILDRDHHAIDADLNDFVASANALLGQIHTTTDLRPKAEVFLDQLRTLDRLLNRHLTDEEDLVVPVVLKYGAPAV